MISEEVFREKADDITEELSGIRKALEVIAAGILGEGKEVLHHKAVHDVRRLWRYYEHLDVLERGCPSDLSETDEEKIMRVEKETNEELKKAGEMDREIKRMQ